METKVESKNPVISCLASQYAGWNLSHKKFYALASGPGRAIARREDLFKDLKYKYQFEFIYLVMEVDKTPPKEIIEKRLQRIEFELSHKSNFVFSVVNDKLEDATNKILEIIQNETKGVLNVT